MTKAKLVSKAVYVATQLKLTSSWVHPVHGIGNSRPISHEKVLHNWRHTVKKGQLCCCCLICLTLRSCWMSPTTGCSARLWTIQLTHYIHSSLHSPQHHSTTIWDDARTTDSCQHKLVTCVQKTSLHERCIRTVIEFLLVCTVYAVRFLKQPCVLLRYVSCTNKEMMMMMMIMMMLLRT